MILTKSQKIYRKNRKKIRGYQKKYYETHKKLHADKDLKWKRDNPDKYKEYQHKYRRSDAGKLNIKISNHRRRALRIATSDGSVTKQAINGMYVGQDYKCNLCGDSIKDNYHIDHIYPLSKGGSHTIKNIQLLCPHCNLTKSNGLP